jgi:hypothetical protein
MAWKLQMLGAAVAVSALAGSSSAQSTTNTVLTAGITGQADVRNLLLTQEDSSVEEARWGGYRGGYGGYRGGYGYRGWYGGYRGWYGGYRGWYGGYYGPRFAYGYGYSYYPYYYYPRVYYYSPYYAYPGTVYVVPTTLTDSTNPAAAPPEVPPQENMIQPRLVPPAATNPYAIPSEGTYRYDGGPSNPVPPARRQPDGKPALGTIPLEGRPVSLPAKPTQFAYPAYGDPPARTNFAVDRVAMSKTGGK